MEPGEGPHRSTSETLASLVSHPSFPWELSDTEDYEKEWSSEVLEHGTSAFAALAWFLIGLSL